MFYQGSLNGTHIAGMGLDTNLWVNFEGFPENNNA